MIINLHPQLLTPRPIPIIQRPGLDRNFLPLIPLRPGRERRTAIRAEFT